MPRLERQTAHRTVIPWWVTVRVGMKGLVPTSSQGLHSSEHVGPPRFFMGTERSWGSGRSWGSHSDGSSRGKGKTLCP